MKNLIVCLGYNPNDDGIILPILEGRLNDCIKLSRENRGSILLLMGGNTFRNTKSGGFDQSLLMKKYIETHASNLLVTTEIITENKASSTVRELCFVREFIDKRHEKYKIYIVASEFFVDRVKLYSEYIFENLSEINFVASLVSDNDTRTFKEVEEYKLKKGIQWLGGYKKGDYATLLREQDEFEKKIMSGEIYHPVSK